MDHVNHNSRENKLIAVYEGLSSLVKVSCLRCRKSQQPASEAAPMDAEAKGQAGEGEEGDDSASDLDSWLVSDSSDEKEDAAGVHALEAKKKSSSISTSTFT